VSLTGQVVSCHPVAEARWFLERSAFLERRCMEILAAWVWNTGDLDCKLVFGTHAYEEAIHADLCLQRSGELHTALPSYGWRPQPLDLDRLDLLCREVVGASTLACKLSGFYGALKPWLLQQYEEYLHNADPILEGPTIRLLERVIQEERRQIIWGQTCLRQRVEAAPEQQEEVEQWRLHLEKLLSDPAAPGKAEKSAAPDEPLLLFTGATPANDPRVHLVYYTPGQGPSADVEFDPQSESEVQQIMLSTLVVVEAEAAELLCRILVEFPNLPWQMRLQLSRQMWDECRHAASQWRLLRQHGADLGSHPSIAYINRFVGDEPDVFKRLIVLQRVVEGISVDQHRPRGRYFLNEKIYPLVQMFDYILADEDTHIAFSRWITILVGNDSAHLQELADFQARKEQEYAEYSDWLISKRRDLARLYSTPGSVQAGKE